MNKQLDPYAPYVPEGAYVPQVGDKVRFRMGERMGSGCPSCGYVNLSIDEHHEHNGKEFHVLMIDRDDFDAVETSCTWCKAVHAFRAEPFAIAIDANGIHPAGRSYAGIWVCANELTLIKKRSDNA